MDLSELVMVLMDTQTVSHYRLQEHTSRQHQTDYQFKNCGDDEDPAKPEAGG